MRFRHHMKSLGTHAEKHIFAKAGGQGADLWFAGLLRRPLRVETALLSIFILCILSNYKLNESSLLNTFFYLSLHSMICSAEYWINIKHFNRYAINTIPEKYIYIYMYKYKYKYYRCVYTYIFNIKLVTKHLNRQRVTIAAIVV